MKKIIFGICLSSLMTFSACQKYLDVVPDNIATIQDAFVSRVMSERYLHTCYSYLPVDGNPESNPGFLAGDEMWLYEGFDLSPQMDYKAWQIGRGEMGVNTPLLNYWDGEQGGKDLYQAIRDCNIFLENIHIPLDLNSYERDQWIAEVNFLKAYYHFYLLRLYGPIVIVDKNLPISSTPDEVRVYRNTVDEVVEYIVNTIDKAVPNLETKVMNPITDLGRITKPVALAIKARVLLYAASPLFNGNTEMASLVDNRGTQLFSQEYSDKKWERAMVAAKEAIQEAEASGAELYEFEATAATGKLSEQTNTLLSIQGAVTERWNKEVIWGLTNSNTHLLQHSATARVVGNWGLNSLLAPTMKIVEMFYSKNGVPIDEDRNYPYASRMNLRVADESHKHYIKDGQTTAQINFDREPRFYADLGFDRGIWYGLGKYDDSGNDLHYVKAKFKETAGRTDISRYSSTGYWAKKLVNYANSITAGALENYSHTRFAWPNVRLGDLYLMYAEAANEFSGPNAESIAYLDRIRERAGLNGVVESWKTHSINPNKPTTKDGLRDIIQRERLIEMAFEGSRFYDLRRWKIAPDVMNQPVRGWDIEQEHTENYYRERILYNQRFGLKDYFWPIKDNNILINKNLVQNLGW